ncbi:MAG TPA: Ku protein [Acidimicrobiales bacterium]|nr:Ku protein [Acidimicrobiales bacterium]
MPRPIWSGAISFGLVNIPVKLVTAVRKQDVRFHQLHAKDGVRIQQRRVCPDDGEEVPWSDLVKGYEIAPGRYVVIEPDELEALDPEATHTIDIEDFVALDQVDPVYLDTTYYAVPDAAGTRAYRLLHRAVQDSGRVGIGKVVLRTKQYLCAVRPTGEALAVSTMNFADEVLGQEDLTGLPAPDGEVPERELRLAAQLIEAMATDFDPSRYEDTYRAAVMRLIEAKAAGEQVVTEPARPAAPVVDLMAALEASLSSADAGDEGRDDDAASAG